MVAFGEGKKPSQERRTNLSFGEIVGQRELKRALLAVATNDALGGLLIRGEKGTAKSTAVRALTDLLPPQRAVADCAYGCPPDDPGSQCADCRARTNPPVRERPVPLVTLPLGASRDRVVGTLSVASALDGEHEFDHGLLARANRGILYVDEVNLLDDHLVDVLLDVAAGGVNRVERDGVSVVHPAEFTLVGTMNPEEGTLRPQLRDRFALQATVTGCSDLDDRVEIIDRALGRDESRVDRGVTEREEETDALRRKVRDARNRLDSVTLPREFATDAAELCRDAGVEGHRADIATARAATTFAALEGRTKVVASDVRRAAELALPHRLQSRPFEDTPDPGDVIDEHFDDGANDAEDNAETGENEGEGSNDSETDGGAEAADESEGSDRERSDEDAERGGDDADSEGDRTGDGDGSAPSTRRGRKADATGESDDGGTDGDVGRNGDGDASGDDDSGGGDGNDGDDGGGGGDDDGSDSEAGTPLVPGQRRAGVGEGRAPDITASEAVRAANASGTRSRSKPAVGNEGPRVRTRRADVPENVDAAASVRAAAVRGGSAVESRDLRQSVRAGDTSALVLFVVDASASMRSAMRTAKGTVLELLKDAYRQRDEVAFVTFAGDGAEVVLPPTDSVSLAARHLKDLPTGDRTPLPAGLRTAGEVLRRADPASSVVVLVTDGRANVADGSPIGETRDAARKLSDFDTHVVVVDADDDRTGVAELIADETGGERVSLSALSAERIDATVGAARETEL